MFYLQVAGPGGRQTCPSSDVDVMTATWRTSASSPLRRALLHELTHLLASVDKTVDITPAPLDVTQVQQAATYAATSEFNGPR